MVSDRRGGWGGGSSRSRGRHPAGSTSNVRRPDGGWEHYRELCWCRGGAGGPD